MSVQRPFSTLDPISRMAPAYTRHACPNCGEVRMTMLYEVRRVPVHSCHLIEDSIEAQRYPCGDVHLASCSACGFLSNLSFTESLVDYSDGYEVTQHYSGHFNAFAKQLASEWIENHDIRNKTILEIGCGTGEFLDLICRLGNNNGIGIDPVCDPSRLPESANGHIRLIRDKFSTEHGALEPDVIICRHTLEHIANTGEFMSVLREAIGDREDTLVIFELPDTGRVLREKAFWDIYYEHCSYFTLGSLARLFRRNSFDVIDLQAVYDDQYLVIAARPAARPTEPGLDQENDLEKTARELESFRIGCPAKITFWQEQLRHYANEGKKVVAWGSGSKSVSFCTTLGISAEIAYIVDINPNKNGMYMPGSGHRIVAPEYLLQDMPDIVIAMNPVYRAEIQATLDQLGCGAELLAL